MKKIMQIIIALIGIYFVFQFFVNMFITRHNVNYSMVKDNITYDINEVYNEKGYFFKVVDAYKNIFLFSYDYDYNKQEKVLSNIKHYTSGNLKCILPIYKNNKTGNLSCNMDGDLVSYSYLKQINNPNILNILSKVNTDKLTPSENDYSGEKEIIDNISVYKKNLDDNFIYTMWFYKGVYIINNKANILKKDYLTKDSYENNYSALVGKYYVSFNTDEIDNFKIYSLIAYNIQDGGSKNVEVSFSNNIYINGVVDKKMYFTDLDNKKQFVFDPYKGEVSETDKFFNYVDGKLVKVDSNDFFKQVNIYSDNIENSKISTKYSSAEIKKYGSTYYFKTDDGSIYEVINNDYNNPIKLFKFDNLTEWDVKEGVVVAVNKDTVYTYTANNGLRPIIVNSELQYNHKNIFDFMKK